MSNIIKLKSDAKKPKVKIKDSTSSRLLEEKEESRQTEQQLLEHKLQAKYDDGFKIGRESIREELNENYNAKLLLRYEELNKAFGSIEESTKEYGRVFSDLVIKLSTMISEKVIRREIDKNTIVKTVVKEALNRIIGANSVQVKMNPEELKQIMAESNNIFSDETYSNLKFEPDERIDAGGALVITEIGNVDGRISTQLCEIKKQLDSFYSGLEE